MNIQHDVINCKVCRQPRLLLDHELTVKIIKKEGDSPTYNPKIKVVNLRLYCKNCAVNYNEPFPYDDERCVKPFIEDVKKHSAQFDKIEYIEVPA